jgi:hypothetical protein
MAKAGIAVLAEVRREQRLSGIDPRPEVKISRRLSINKLSFIDIALCREYRAMTRTESAALPTAQVVLRLLVVLNWLSGAGILALLLAMVIAPNWTLTALGVEPASEIPRLLLPMQAIAALGVVAVPFYNAILQRLIAIVATVRDGDPFVAANALRLQGIAWALLALQLISMVIGGIADAVSTRAVPLHLDAGFSVSGWLFVLLTFILARVFAEGARMRADLEGTV